MSSENSGLQLSGVTVAFGHTTAVDSLDLAVTAGTILAVLGPSGCGKSTLLRAVGGLLPLEAGSVFWEGSDITQTPPHKRGFGLMFQDHALFTHRTVGENIGFGLRMKRQGAPERSRRVGEILDLLDMPGYEDRSIGTLSGGEAQRVALGRALAPEPRLLMLDEPLASLDRDLSDRLVTELRVLLTQLGMTAIYVTHDQHEAFAVADQIAIMRSGKITALGDPRDLRESPPDETTARFLGLTNIYDVITRSGESVSTAWGVVPTPRQGDPSERILIRPEAVRVRPGAGAVVKSSTYRGETSEMVLELADGSALSIVRDEPLVPGSEWKIEVQQGGTAWLP